MKSRIPLTALIILAALMVLGPGVGAAKAQSDSDLRLENQSLKTQVEDLTIELNAARERIAALEAEIARLRAGGGSSQSVAPTPGPEKTTVDESKPNASPRALLTALKKSYEDELKDHDMGRFGSTERTNYLRALEHWRAGVTNKFRASIEWHVRPDRPVQPTARGGVILSLVAVDPVTDVQLGGPFEVFLARSLARRLAAAEERSEIDKLVLKGVLLPAVWINPDRAEPGTFDNPPLIGPYAEFGFRIEVRTLIPAQKKTGDESAGESEDEEQQGSDAGEEGE